MQVRNGIVRGREVLANVIASSVDEQARYGGVVPEVAARAHLEALVPTVRAALAEAGVERPDAVAATIGPGLSGALLVGSSAAKAYAAAWGVPFYAVNHLVGHVAVAGFDGGPLGECVALLVSGGHTQLVEVQRLGCYRLLGESVDDAAGEAFDKAAKMLGLAYPGGPLVAKLAEQGDPKRFRFPRPMTDRPGLDFSFSGLQTHTLTTIRQLEAAGELDEQAKADVARAFEEAVVDTLVIKCRRALDETGLKRIVMAGGVSANTRLRERLALETQKRQARAYYPRGRFCTDNGAMIAYVGAQRLAAGERDDSGIMQATPRWPLDTLTAPLSSTR
mgnify:CR=1 FL=1